VTHDAENPQGDIAVVNTCGFIEDAKQESIDTILELAQAKEEGQLKKLFVMGCLSERYLAELEAEIPEVDGWYGKFNYKQLLKDLDRLENLDNLDYLEAHRHITTPRHYAYLKISEGCDRHCAYCAIPLITGRDQSRPMQEILDEVRWLVSQGTCEFQVIAQELTYYGIDIDGKQHIAELIEKMADIEGVEWIRLHYAYPAHFPWELLRVMREKKNVCKYLDIALQHISDHMLDRMQRHVTKEQTYELIRRLREEVPGIHLRTTLMVGFPGETDEDFQELIAFTNWARFERMGAFAYSEEEGTYAAKHYIDDIPQEEKERRVETLMAIQQEISSEILSRMVGTEQRVVIDREEEEYYVGRTQYDSPEVDCEVLIEKGTRSQEQGAKTLKTGEYYTVTIIKSEDFDLYATL
jgi:ribosomal protein S12 methylthiotransferase